MSVESRELQGKVAVITGASKGIGRKIAERLAQEGADCFLISRNNEMLANAASAIESESGVTVGWTAADLGGEDGCRRAAETAIEKFGKADILVNCAGATKAGAFPEQGEEDWLDGFSLKFHGAVRLCRYFWPHLVAQKGTVINIGGAAVYSPNANFMVGGAVNAALAHFSKSLALQGLKDDVNVNIVHPGQTLTDRLEMLLETNADLEGVKVDEIKQRSIETSGIRRLGHPEDVAELVAFLCTPKARHIHGVGIAVDGGATSGFH